MPNNTPENPAHALADRPTGRTTARTFTAGAVAIAFALATALADAEGARAAGTPSVAIQTAPSEGGTITVSGSGFDGTQAGIYLGVGPSGIGGFYAGSSELIGGNTIWIGPGLSEGTAGGQRTAPLTADGTFAVSVTVPAHVAGGVGLSVYTSLAHGAGVQDPSRDTETKILHTADPQSPTEPEPPTEPANPGEPGGPAAPTAPAETGTDETGTAVLEPTTAPVCVARAVNNATLTWGIKSGFRNYISGGIAHGSWSLSNVTYGGGQFGWSGGSGSVNATTAQGVARFGGSVAFAGHDGALQLRVSNPLLQLNSATQATLFADVTSTSMDGETTAVRGIAFATVSMPAARVGGSQIVFDGAPASLTTAGAAAFAGFYEAGTALDPVSARLPLGVDVPCDAYTGAALANTGSGTGSRPLLAAIAVLLVVGGTTAHRVSRRRSRTHARQE